MSDEELVQKSLQNIDYFAYIYERYEQKLIRYILRISSFSFSEAEEVLQESFIKAWQNLNEFDADLKFSSWIYRIVHNTTISEWKKSHSKGKDKKRDISEDIFNNLPSSLDIPKELDRKLHQSDIKKILKSMPEKYREVLILKFLEEKNYQEISDILRKPKGTVATLIHRAKQNFIYVARKYHISFFR